MRKLLWSIPVAALITTAACVSGSPSEQSNQPIPGNTNSNAGVATSQPVMTDAELKSKVLEELAADPRTSGRDISVEASSGSITLSGKVDTEEAKAAANEAAGKVARIVNNQLQVAPETVRPQTEVSDKDIQAALEKLVNEDDKISQLTLIWTVKNGVVSLDGLVETNDQLGYAVQAISKIPGVKSVKKGSVKVQDNPPPK